jgi:NADH-quinone oxidoreductase subunit D
MSKSFVNKDGKVKKVDEDRVTFSLPLGPLHPMYVEAENLNVYLDGETIVNVDVNVGYLHRGIEELMQRRNYLQNIYLSERICGICSGIHSVTYCQVVENLLDIDIPERATVIRTLTLELERLHSHLLYLGVVGYEIGMDTLFMYTWKDREFVMDMLEQISGNRVNYAMPTVGGVRRDIPNHIIPGMLKKLDYLEKRSKYYTKVFSNDGTILARTRGLGILSKEKVEDLSIVGPVARGSGLKTDIRRDSPYLNYDDLNWDVIVRKENDNRARVMVKVLEMFQSINILRQCLSRLDRLDRDIFKKVTLNIPPAEAISVTEAPRGELLYYALSNGTDKPERMRIRTPSFVNLMYAIPIVLKEQQLADLPITVASLDPCFSCTDRMTLIDTNSGEKKTVDETYLKRLEQGRKSC